MSSAHATVAKDAKVENNDGIRGGFCVRGFRFAHATVAKDAKVDNREGLRCGLSGSRIKRDEVINFL